MIEIEAEDGDGEMYEIKDEDEYYHEVIGDTWTKLAHLTLCFGIKSGGLVVTFIGLSESVKTWPSRSFVNHVNGQTTIFLFSSI